jgi:hypothetical protein
MAWSICQPRWALFSAPSHSNYWSHAQHALHRASRTFRSRAALFRRNLRVSNDVSLDYGKLHTSNPPSRIHLTHCGSHHTTPHLTAPHRTTLHHALTHSRTQRVPRAARSRTRPHLTAPHRTTLHCTTHSLTHAPNVFRVQPARERDRARQDLLCLSRILHAAVHTKKVQLDEQLGRVDDNGRDVSASTSSSAHDGSSSSSNGGSGVSPVAATSGDSIHPVVSASTQFHNSVNTMVQLADARASDVSRAAAAMREALQNRRGALQAEQQACADELASVAAVVDDAESAHMRRLRAGDLLAELTQVRTVLQEAVKAEVNARHQWERLNLQCVAPLPLPLLAVGSCDANLRLSNAIRLFATCGHN